METHISRVFPLGLLAPNVEHRASVVKANGGHEIRRSEEGGEGEAREPRLADRRALCLRE